MRIWGIFSADDVDNVRCVRTILFDMNCFWLYMRLTLLLRSRDIFTFEEKKPIIVASLDWYTREENHIYVPVQTAEAADSFCSCRQRTSGPPMKRLIFVSLIRPQLPTYAHAIGYIAIVSLYSIGYPFSKLKERYWEWELELRISDTTLITWVIKIHCVVRGYKQNNNTLSYLEMDPTCI